VCTALQLGGDVEQPWLIYLFIYLFINSGIEFNTSITQQQQYKPEKERKGYK